MNAYKFLSAGATGLYSGFAWPAPRNGEPGEWVEVRGQLAAGVNGVHALRSGRLVDWLDDELWLVELGDEVEEQEEMLVARRGRLVSRVDGWDEDLAREFGESCIWRGRERAVEALRRAGLERESAALTEVEELEALKRAAAEEGRSRTGAVADALIYLADTVEVSRGGWFETYDGHPGAGTAPTPWAIAANIGFVSAVAAGGDAVDKAGAPEVFDDGYERERARQLAWLTGRLDLEPL